ncbi:MAG: glycosyltransferase family 2 protein [Bacteroidota bacterium]
MKNEQPLVSIVTVNYNQSEVTCEMIDSLKQITYPNYEVIVVDNASPNDEPEIITYCHQDIKFIKSIRNLGFAGGNNLGVKEATGKYVLFLNNDTEVAPDFLEPLVEAFETNPKLGMASPKIIYHGTDNIIQYAGAVSISPYTGKGYKIGHGEHDIGQFNQSSYTGLGHGAALMVPMKVIKEVGLMPDIFFLYYEEHDWCEMVKRAGYHVMYVAHATIYHKESVSVGRNSPLKTYYMARNRLLYIRRNCFGGQLIFSLLFFLLLAIPKNILKYTIRGEWALLRCFLKGVAWHLKPANVYLNPRLAEDNEHNVQITNYSFPELVKL